MIEYFLIFIADFIFDSCEICIHPELFSKSLIFLQVSDLSKIIRQISSIATKLGTIHLDKDNPYECEIKINLDVSDYTDKVIIVVDDVLNSGKTLMYASKHFLTNSLIKLSTLVLVDRTHNRFPIKADYVGLSLATTLKEYITVILDGEEQGVYLS